MARAAVGRIGDAAISIWQYVHGAMGAVWESCAGEGHRSHKVPGQDSGCRGGEQRLLHRDLVKRWPSKVRKRMQSCHLFAVEFKEAGMRICYTHWIATLLWVLEVIMFTLPAHNQLIAY